MGPEPDDARRAAATFTLVDGKGQVVEQGAGTALVDDERLHIGPLVVAHLDADALRIADHRIAIDRWPGGQLVIAGLGRRFDTFARALAQARNRARVAGLLAHGLAAPEVFDGAVLDEDRHGRAEIHVYDTHVTMVPQTGQPWQVPFGALTAVEAIETPAGVVLGEATTRITLGWLARRRDALLALVSGHVHRQRRLLSELTGQDGFADGLGLPRDAVQDFDRSIARFTAPSRVAPVREVLGAADAAPRLGFVKLLDPDDTTLEAPTALPAHWASFVLAPVRGLTVLEIASGPSAATYVFEGGIDAINRDLQALHFRRAPLALGDEAARLTHDNPLRLALRALEPLRRLRDATRARVVHDEGWKEAFRAAMP
jgi:hypothetical protein